MPDTVKRLLEIYEVVEQITLVLFVLFYDDSTIEGLFYWLRPGLKPACSSASSSSALALSLLETTQNIILLEWLNRLMVR